MGRPVLELQLVQGEGLAESSWNHSRVRLIFTLPNHEIGSLDRFRVGLVTHGQCAKNTRLNIEGRARTISKEPSIPSPLNHIFRVHNPLSHVMPGC